MICRGYSDILGYWKPYNDQNILAYLVVLIIPLINLKITSNLQPLIIIPDFTMMQKVLLSVVALLAAHTAAHGAVTSYVIAGTTYPG